MPQIRPTHHLPLHLLIPCHPQGLQQHHLPSARHCNRFGVFRVAASARMPAEAARTAGAVHTAEAARMPAEAARMPAEAARMNAEAARTNAEVVHTAEAARMT